MAINLQKGQRVDIGLQHVTVGLGWDPNTTGGQDYDLDASAFMLGADGKLAGHDDDFLVFYGHQTSIDGAVASSGDDTSGGNSDGGDDESLDVKLDKVSGEIQEIVFVVTIYEAIKRRQNFGQVRNAYIRICDANTNEEICRYDLDEDFSTQNGVEFGRLYRRNGAWRFEALGTGTVCQKEFGLEDYIAKYQK